MFPCKDEVVGGTNRTHPPEMGLIHCIYASRNGIPQRLVGSLCRLTLDCGSGLRVACFHRGNWELDTGRLLAQLA